MIETERMMKTSTTKSIRQPNPMRVKMKSGEDPRVGCRVLLKADCQNDLIEENIFLSSQKSTESAGVFKKSRNRYNFQPGINEIPIKDQIPSQDRIVGETNEGDTSDIVQLRQSKTHPNPSTMFRRRLSVRIPNNTVVNLARKFNTMAVNQEIPRFKPSAIHETEEICESVKGSQNLVHTHNDRSRTSSHSRHNGKSFEKYHKLCSKSKSNSCGKNENEGTEEMLSIQSENPSVSFPTDGARENAELTNDSGSIVNPTVVPVTTSNNGEIDEVLASSIENYCENPTASDADLDEQRMVCNMVNAFKSKLSTTSKSNVESETRIPSNTERGEVSSHDKTCPNDRVLNFLNIQTTDEKNEERSVKDETQLVFEEGYDGSVEEAYEVNRENCCPDEYQSYQNGKATDSSLLEESLVYSELDSTMSIADQTEKLETCEGETGSQSNARFETTAGGSAYISCASSSVDFHRMVNQENESMIITGKENVSHDKSNMNMKKMKNNFSFLWCCQKPISKLRKNTEIEKASYQPNSKNQSDAPSKFYAVISSNQLTAPNSLKDNFDDKPEDIEIEEYKTGKITKDMDVFHLEFSGDSLEKSIEQTLKMLNIDSNVVQIAEEKQDSYQKEEEYDLDLTESQKEVELEYREPNVSQEEVSHEQNPDTAHHVDSERDDQPLYQQLPTDCSLVSSKQNVSSDSEGGETSCRGTPLRSPSRQSSPRSDSRRHGVVIDLGAIYISASSSESSSSDALSDQTSVSAASSQSDVLSSNYHSVDVSVSSTSSVIYVNAEPVSDQDDAGVGDESTDCDRTLTETTTPLRHVHVEREGGESQELSVWIGSENGGSTPDVRRGSQSSTTDTVSTIESIKDVNEPDHVSEVVEKCNNEDSEPEENIYEVIQCPDSNVRASSPVTNSSSVPASQNHSSRTSPKNSTSDVSHDQSSNSVGMKQKLKENWNTTKKGWKRIRRRTIVPALADISKAIKVASSSSETSSYRDHEHRPVVSRPLSSGGSISSDMGGYSERSAFYLDLTPDSVSSDQRRMLTVDDPVVNLARCVEPLTHKFLDASDRSELNSDSSSDTIELDADERRAEQKKHRLTPVKTDGPYTQLKSRTRDSVTEYSVGSSTRSVPGSPRCSRFYTELPSNSSDGGVQSETEHRPTGSKKSLRCQRSVPNFTSSSRAALTSPPPVPDQPRPSSGPAYRPASASLTVSSSSGSSADAAFIGATSYLLNEEPLYQVYMRNQSGAIFDDGSVSSGSIYEEVGQLRSSPLNAGDCQVKPVTPVIEVSQSDGQRSLWSHLPEVINSGILDGLDSDERRLQEAVFELISSEASYIRSLRLLVSHFANDSVLSSHEDKHQTPAVISRHDHSVLFSNSTKVLECSESFLSELQQCLHEDIMMKNVSTILEKHASNHFDSYIQYCASQYLQDRKLEQLSESNQVFVENLSRLEAASCCQSLKLHSFLMLPMQRVTRLPLLVSATLCRLQENHPQFDGWQTAYRAVKQLAEKCNEEACKSQRLEELISISNKFVFKNMKTFPLANSNRSLVKKSSMIWTRAKVDDNKMTFGRKGSRQQVVNLFLFTDVLIITKKKSSDGMYTVLDYCPRSMLQLSELDDKSDKFLLTLLCNHEEKTVELMMSCPAHSERLRWCEAINPTVQTENDEETVYQSWDCPQVCVHTAYVARDGDELALDPGDVIKVLRKLPDGWLQGEKLIGSKSGWFPSSCCTEIVSEHTRARNLRQRYKLLRVTANYLQQQQNRTTKSSKQPRSK